MAVPTVVSCGRTTSSRSGGAAARRELVSVATTTTPGTLLAAVHSSLMNVSVVPARLPSPAATLSALLRYSSVSSNRIRHGADAVVELAGAKALVRPLAGRAIKRGVDDNLDELKRLLETPVRVA